MKLHPLRQEDIIEKLTFVEKRLGELLELNNGDLAGADATSRQQLLQEFFFHVVGAIDVLAQLVNQEQKLGFEPDKVNVRGVENKLSDTDPIRALLSSLYSNPNKRPLPENPYSDEGYIYRLYNYRNHVTHRRRNPFFIAVYLNSPGTSRETRLMLDPRDPNSGPSNKLANAELMYILRLVRIKCEGILTLIYK